MAMYFVNVDYNHESPNGQSKFCWAVREFDLGKQLSDQLHAMLEEIGHMKDEVFNLNLTAFTPVGCSNSEEELTELRDLLKQAIGEKPQTQSFPARCDAALRLT